MIKNRFCLAFLFCLISQSAALVQAQVIDGRIVLSPKSFDNKNKSIELFHNWKYHGGDNLAWADPLFDDSNWEMLDTPLQRDKLPQDGWTGIGWFRLHFEVDLVLWEQPLTMLIRQIGASEIYLDGTLIYSIGKVGISADGEVAVHKHDLWVKHIIIFSRRTDHVITVRHSNFLTDFFYKLNHYALGFELT